GTPEERRRHLFGAYIRAMFQRRGKQARYPQQQTLRWLSWLARGMTQQAQTVFLVEGLQPTSLPTRAIRLQYALLDRCIGVLVSGRLMGLGGMVVSGLLVGLGIARGGGQVSALLNGLLGGLVGGLVVGLLALFFGGQTNGETLQQRPMQRTTIDALLGGLL